TALRADLVLDVHRAGARLDERAGRARHVEGRGPEAGVDIDQQGQVAYVGDAPHVDEDVLEPGAAEVGQAERAGGDAADREVDRPVAGMAGEKRMVGVDRARDLERFLGRKRFTEPAAS